MKHLTMMMALVAICATSCAPTQIATLNMVSSRNIDYSQKYIMLGRDVQAKGKAKNHDPLERALDNAVKQFPTGEYMMNVRVYVNGSGSKVRVEGDVWGRDTTVTR